MFPAGKRIEGQGLWSGILVRFVLLSPTACRVLLATVEPVAGERLAAENRLYHVDSGPVREVSHQILLTTMAENVPEPLDLGGLLVADEDRAVARGEDLGP